jgi:hypothetical protein
MRWFSSIGDLFVPHPIVALIPAIIFFGAGVLVKNRFLLVVAAIWGLYSIYEFLMKARILCSGDCNIRIDLLGIYPALVTVSTVGIMLWLKRLIERSAD